LYYKSGAGRRKIKAIFDDLGINKWERCQSGRSSTLGKRVYRKVTRVRIPLSPQV
jgi:hypothetical protein